MNVCVRKEQTNVGKYETDKPHPHLCQATSGNVYKVNNTFINNQKKYLESAFLVNIQYSWLSLFWLHSGQT